MRKINCIVCGSEKKITLEKQKFDDDYLALLGPTYQNIERSLVICENCGFVFHDPQLDENDLDNLYLKFRDTSFRNETPDEYFDRITQITHKESENHSKVTWMAENIPELKNSHGRLLDIGCGGGVFLHTFKKVFSDWDISGIEPTIAYAELAARRLNANVLPGNYKSGMFDERFDLISINHVLEHVIDPISFLTDVKKDLKPEGLVYIEVPDISDLAHLNPNHDRFMMQHLWVFSAKSFTNICHIAGYKVKTLTVKNTIRQKKNLIAILKPSTKDCSKELFYENYEDVLILRSNRILNKD